LDPKPRVSAFGRIWKGIKIVKITDVRTTVWEWIGPVAALPHNFCTNASDLVAREVGAIGAFRFLGWLVVEIETDAGIIGIGNAALSPFVTKAVIDNHLRPLLVGESAFDIEYLWERMYRVTHPFGRKGSGMAAISAVGFINQLLCHLR